jgi:hypothetical protein
MSATSAEMRVGTAAQFGFFKEFLVMLALELVAAGVVKHLLFLKFTFFSLNYFERKSLFSSKQIPQALGQIKSAKCNSEQKVAKNSMYPRQSLSSFRVSNNF